MFISFCNLYDKTSIHTFHECADVKFLWSDLKISHTTIFGILDYVSNELFFDNKKVFINDILLILKFILFYHSFYLWWKIVCSFFLQNLSNKKQDMLKLRNCRESVSLIKNKFYILYMSLLQRNMFSLFCFLFFGGFFVFKLKLTQWKAEQLLQGMDLQEKEMQKD